MDLARSLPSGSTIRRTPRRWPSAARRWGRRRWSPHQPWTGRPCVRSVGRPIPSGVPPAGRCSCARASSRVGVLLPSCSRRSAPHESCTAGEACQGRSVPGGGRGTGHTLGGAVLQDHHGAGTALTPSGARPAGPDTGRMTWGRRHVNSIARGCQTWAGRIRARSVQPNAIRSAQGRACVHRGALSPEHSR